ncbi:hypothetical protein NC651_028020 [Populus alba x Populus x berolinensis]|nr:hypothetical protein NC651_028020 [Populus alba x Populus x berolinensis]
MFSTTCWTIYLSSDDLEGKEEKDTPNEDWFFLLTVKKKDLLGLTIQQQLGNLECKNLGTPISINGIGLKWTKEGEDGFLDQFFFSLI